MEVLAASLLLLSLHQGKWHKAYKSLKLKFIPTSAGCLCSEPASRKARNLGASEEVDAAAQSADYKVTRDASHYVNCECHAAVCWPNMRWSHFCCVIFSSRWIYSGITQLATTSCPLPTPMTWSTSPSRWPSTTSSTWWHYETLGVMNLNAGNFRTSELRRWRPTARSSPSGMTCSSCGILTIMTTYGTPGTMSHRNMTHVGSPCIMTLGCPGSGSGRRTSSCTTRRGTGSRAARCGPWSRWTTRATSRYSPSQSTWVSAPWTSPTTPSMSRCAISSSPPGQQRCLGCVTENLDFR